MKKRVLALILLASCFTWGCGKEEKKENIKDDAVVDEKDERGEAQSTQKEITVSWTNDINDEDFSPSGDNTIVTFSLEDGSTQDFDLGLPLRVSSMEMLDINNDSDDEYVINGEFCNTASEYEMIFAFEKADSKIVQIYPFDELYDEAGDSVINSSITELVLNQTYEDDQAINAISVYTLEKHQDEVEGGTICDTSYSATVYCLDGQWHIKDAEFKTYEKTIEEVASELNIPDGAEIEYEEWVDSNQTVYRVALQRTKEDPDEYLHLMDYFLFKEEDGAVITIKVDYPSSKDSLYSDRYVGAVCDFSAEFVDVTFDGHKDLVISLGDFGAQGAAGYCAYVYEDGAYVYKKSFEEIPNYVIDESNHCITGSSRGNAATYYDYVFEYIDGEFVNTDTQETVYSE